MKAILAALAVATVTLAIVPEAEARGGDNAVSQSRARLKAEWARARAVGGYGNPLTVLFALVSEREVPAGQIQRPLQSEEALDVEDIRID